MGRDPWGVTHGGCGPVGIDRGDSKYSRSILSNATQGEHPALLSSRPLVVPRFSLVFLTVMFTGLVETVGSVKQIRNQPPGKLLTIATDAFVAAEDDPDKVAIGDSISINGCCLTVVRIGDDDREFDFEAGEETLARTNLGRLNQGDGVNLERALAVGDRLGGHYVTGHIDAVGTLTERRDDPPWSHLTFGIPTRLASQIASKGSIAIDGISLTVVDADQQSFSVALIPHTLSETTLGVRQVGDEVNLETDVLAKYVERSLQFTREST
tara:strand:- start:325175 stop:325978 length:804 start_codon:yes stop_codon:yes gene_type:complete